MPTCFHRTAEDQANLYAQGRTKPGKIITYCDGYEKVSAHQRWRAIDFVVVKDDELIWERTPEYETLGSFWEMIGGVWGGERKWHRFLNLNDIFHFEEKQC